MRSSADRLSQLGVDQFLKGLLHQVTEQEPDLVTAKLRDELSQSGLMALGHRVSSFQSTADGLPEDSTVAPSGPGSTYTTRWVAYRLSPGHVMARRKFRMQSQVTRWKENVMGELEEYGETISGGAEGVSESIRQAPRAIEQRTRGNPLAVGLIAVGA